MAEFRSKRQVPGAFANADRNVEFWLLEGPGWLLLGYLVYAQAIPAFNYQLGVSMRTQESAAVISDVGVAFWHGFALADIGVVRYRYVFDHSHRKNRGDMSVD